MTSIAASIERLGRAGLRVEVARSHLLYGEWLRREGRRVDAREQLRTAHDMLNAMGLEAFSERARRELVATGERVRKRTPDSRENLTAQEFLIARLARDGLSNPEIGTRLFLSPRTVEWHLRKVFTKLGVSSRKQLADSLLDAARARRSTSQALSSKRRPAERVPNQGPNRDTADAMTRPGVRRYCRHQP